MVVSADVHGVPPRSAELKNVRQQSGVFQELERIYGRKA